MIAASAIDARAQEAPSTPPLADETTQSPDEVRSLDAVSVTASRTASRTVRRMGAEAPTPTTMVGSEELKDTNVSVFADHLNRLPSFRATTTPGTTSHSSQNAGANFLNLRGLGNNRTLVLVDGARHVPTTTSGLLDVNVLPSAMIERVEVVTGGASAAWGSDAVAGVVNLILRNKIDGVEGRVKYGVSERGDNNDTNISLGAGFDWAGGRANTLIATEYSNSKGVGADRGWFREHWGVLANPAYAAGNGEPQNLIVPDLHVSTGTLGGLITSGPLRGTEFLPGGATRQFQYGSYTGTQYMSGGDGIYPGDLIMLSTPLERGSAYLRNRFQLSDDVSMKVDLSRSFSRTRYNMSTSYDLGNLLVRRDNAFLPADVAARMDALGITSFQMGRINQDIAYNVVSNHNEATRLAAGLEGAFGTYGSWDVSASMGRNVYDAQIFNNRINANFNRARDAVWSGGKVVCRSTLTNPADGCVPLNLFGYGAPSREAIDYITGVQELRSEIKQKTFAANLRGEPFETWAGPVAAAAGVEYRKESVTQTVDAGSLAGVFAIGNPKPIAGDYSVQEAYAEAVLPLASGLPMAHASNLELGLRVAKYSEAGTAKPWKIGLAHEFTPSLKLRMTRSRDIRAPNIAEMYASYLLTFSTLTDPLTGVQSSVRIPQVGNNALRPETAQTITAGLVLQPEGAPNFQASVDYYDIDLSGAISTIGAQEIVSRCAAGNASLCSFIDRNPDGTLAEVRRAFVNLASLRARGVDAEVNYSLGPMQWSLPGEMQLRLLTTYVAEYTMDDGNKSVDYATAAVGQGPQWRGLLSANYTQGAWRFYSEARYVGSGKYSLTETYNDNTIASQTVINGSVRYSPAAWKRWNIELFGGVNNLFDRDPPVAPYTFLFGSPASANAHDIYGRSYNVGMSFKF